MKYELGQLEPQISILQSEFNWNLMKYGPGQAEPQNCYM